MRDYSKIDLPVILPRWKIQLGMDRLRPHWDLLPYDLAVKILAVYNGEERALTITRKDLDSLSDAAWQELERNL